MLTESRVSVGRTAEFKCNIPEEEENKNLTVFKIYSKGPNKFEKYLKFRFHRFILDFLLGRKGLIPLGKKFL